MIDFPWKDLYEKKLAAPFVPDSGDNFDGKYCNNIDKLGENTKEKYEAYLRDEKYLHIFNCFNYQYNNVVELPEKRFVNPHLSLLNGIAEKKLLEKESNDCIESKFSILKKQSNSLSTSALLRQYKNQMGSGVGLNYLTKRQNVNQSKIT